MISAFLKNVLVPDRYMVEHMRVGPGTSLVVDCRTVQNMPGKVFEVNNIPPGAGGVMVVTRYSLAESQATWDNTIAPLAEKFCRVLAHLFFEK